MKSITFILIITIATLFSGCTSKYSVVLKDVSAIGEPLLIDTLSISGWGIASNHKLFEVDEIVCPSGDLYSATVVRKFKYKALSFFTLGYHNKVDIEIKCGRKGNFGTLED